MAEEKKEHTSVLNINELDAKIAALQTLRDAMKAADALGVLGPLTAGTVGLSVAANADVLGVPIDLPEGAFNNKSVPACIELYLSSAPMKKKTNKEIVAALQEGGVETNADNFDTTVAAALFKLKKNGTVLRFKEGWGLASWYPAHIRGAPASPKKNGKKKRHKKPTSPEKKAPVSQVATELKAPPPVQSAQDRIVAILRSNPHAEFSGDEVAAKLPELKRNVVALLLGRLTDPRRKLAEKTTSGKYRLATNVHQMPAVG
jgi:hypothetical protein